MINFFNILAGSQGSFNPFPDIPIILDIGQSNSAGRGEVGRLPEQGYVASPSNIDVYVKPDISGTDNGSWTAMVCGTNTTDVYPTNNRTNNLFNADLSLASNLRDLMGRKVYVINMGCGGTTLEQDVNASEDWNASSSFELLDRFLLYHFDVAISKLPEGSKKVLGVLWHQGETDATDATATSNYQTNLEALITKVRVHDDLLTNVPFFLTKLNFWRSPDTQVTNQTSINNALASVASSDHYSYLIDIDAYPRKEELTTEEKKGVTPSAADDRHTSYLGQIAKGELIYQQIKTINNW